MLKPLKTDQPHRIPPDPDPMRSALQRPVRGRPAIGCRMRSREGNVRLGAVRASVWPRRDRPSRSGSWRIGCGHAGMWSPVHNTSLKSHGDLRCSMKCPREGCGGAGGPRRRRVPRRLGDWPTRGTTRDSPGCSARKGRKTGVVTVARGHRRRGHGGVGAAAVLVT
jgi:hypothetical protein